MFKIIIKEQYDHDSEGQTIEIEHLDEVKRAILGLMDTFFRNKSDSLFVIKKVPEKLEADGDSKTEVIAFSDILADGGENDKGTDT